MSDAPSTLAEAAVWYCEHGFGIIPIAPRGKKPISEHGLNDWFDDPDDARKLWAAHPDLNIGIVCGVPSHGLVVLDVDEDDDNGKHGLDALNDWEDVRGELPSTAVAITGRGGLHYLYRTDRTNIRPSTNAELAVDVRADGGYIVAPPSIHPNGTAYRWMDGCAPWERPIATANGNVYDFLDHVQRNGGAEDGAKATARFELPEHIKQGERNDVLFRFGCSLRHRGKSDEDIMNALKVANIENCTAPLTVGEIKQIHRDVCRYGAGHDGMGTMEGEESGVKAFGNKSGAEAASYEFRKGNKILHNVLGKLLLDKNMARNIDGAPAIWTGQRWEFGKTAFDRVMIEYADDITDHARTEVFKYLQAVMPSVSTDNGFDGRYYVQFQNCTWDVLAEEEVEPKPSMLIIGTLPVDLDLNAPYGDADRFIESLSAGDEQVYRALLEVVGMCMCSRRITDQAAFLIGRAGASGRKTASNGKSTYMGVIQSLIGTENASVLDIATLGQRFQAEHIVGKLANIGDDISDDFLEGKELMLFKKIVTGNQIITDVKGVKGFKFKPTATMLFSMNAMPRIKDTTDGMLRRLAFIPFRRSFRPGDPDYNPRAAEDMAKPENLSRLALIALMQLPYLIDRFELTKIDGMEIEADEVRADNDIVVRWIADEMIEDVEFDDMWSDDMYARFTRWADNSGERYAVTKQVFTKRVLDTLDTLELLKTRDRSVNRRGSKFKLRSRVE